ncbi:unnamed protein product [Trifolium pratense]|uniref:Uncharacterized protein n=1 Tax=Trifolium pratense TaxID=57577 RepID=A0ACB0JJJ8_TRIPR|nr:unnamed protein product [Trifolium pratense]
MINFGFKLKRGYGFKYKLGLFDLMMKFEQVKDRMLLTLQEEEQSCSENDSGDVGFSRPVPENLLILILFVGLLRISRGRDLFLYGCPMVGENR